MRTHPIPSTRHVAVFLDKASAHGRGTLEGIGQYLESRGPWSLFIETRATGRLDRAWMGRWRGDGLIGMIRDRAAVDYLRRLGVPAVATYTHVHARGLPCVVTDHGAIGRLAAEHLLERRFEHFAFTGYEGEPWSDLRRRGFVAAVRAAGHTCCVYPYPSEHRRLAAWERAQGRLAAWIAGLAQPVAIMACNDRHAQRVLDACRRAGVSVPEQAAVVGVDNDEELCRLSDPPLSSVMDDPRRVGYEAARLLDELMSGRRRTDTAHRRTALSGLHQPSSLSVLIPPVQVVTRRSTDITAIEDQVIAQAVRLIRQQACEGIRIEDVVKRTPLSRAVFYRRFEKAMGRSPHAELLRIQLDRVKQLLVRTPWPLARIARLAGFVYPEYMSVAFKRETGMTPGAYRAAHGEGGSRVHS